MVKILDCTIRDGGYYNDWDFDKNIADFYFSNIQKLPVDIVEVGYISKSINEYAGKYFYLNKKIIEELKTLCSLKMAVMIDLKSIINLDEIDQLTAGLENIIDIIRLATNYNDIEKAKEVSTHLKQKGFIVCINLMKFSDVEIDNKCISKISDIDKYTDILYLVDSYGSILPNKLKNSITSIKKITDVKIGFHGHNNLELALANTIIAIDSGVDIVDATITGMGRGAGNLKLELLLVYLNSIDIKNTFVFNELSSIVEKFNDLQKTYNWGTNLPYMISGAFSQPQKKVMDLIKLDRYSFDSIISQIGIKENKKFPIYKPKRIAENIILVGGGESVINHKHAINSFIDKIKNLTIVHCTSKYIDVIKNNNSKILFATSGDETLKFSKSNSISDYILAPTPRKLDPQLGQNINFKELDKIEFINNYTDSSLAIGLQIAVELKAKNIYLIGFDGYKNIISSKESILQKETQEIISYFTKSRKLISLTNSVYKNILFKSIYDQH